MMLIPKDLVSIKLLFIISHGVCSKWGTTGVGCIYRDPMSGKKKISLGIDSLRSPGDGKPGNVGRKDLLMPTNNLMFLKVGCMDFADLWFGAISECFMLYHKFLGFIEEQMAKLQMMVEDRHMTSKQMLKALRDSLIAIPLPDVDMCGFSALVAGWDNGEPFLAIITSRGELTFAEEGVLGVGSGYEHAALVLERFLGSLDKGPIYARSEDVGKALEAGLAYASFNCPFTGGNGYVFHSDEPADDWYVGVVEKPFLKLQELYAQDSTIFRGLPPAK